MNAKNPQSKPAKARHAKEVKKSDSVAPPEVPAQVPAETLPEKHTALNAAARVLAEAGIPMSCKELIAAMSTKGYWTTPGGQTPAATLYAAMRREMTVKGNSARFTQVGPGRFALRPPSA